MVKHLLGCVVAFASLGTLTAHAQLDVFADALDNATVQPAGPRGGVNGKRFWNIQGEVNGQFASYGVVDFRVSDLNIPFTVGDVTAIRMKVYNGPAAFSKDGPFRFYLVEDTTVDIQPDTSPLRYSGGGEGLGLDANNNPQFPVRYQLLDAQYTGTFEPSGKEYIYTFTLTPAAKAYLVQQLNDTSNPNRILRFVATPLAPDVSATFRGATTDPVNFPAPQRLELTVTQASTPVLVKPSAFTIQRGILVSGNLTSLFDIDSDYLVVRKGLILNPAESPITVVVEGTSPVQNPSALAFTFRNRVNTPGLTQVIDLFDWNANNWDTVDAVTAPGTLTDQTFTVTGTNVGRYVRTGDRLMRARYRIRQTGPVTTSDWRSFTDQTVWTVTP